MSQVRVLPWEPFLSAKAHLLCCKLRFLSRRSFTTPPSVACLRRVSGPPATKMAFFEQDSKRAPRPADVGDATVWRRKSSRGANARPGTSTAEPPKAVRTAQCRAASPALGVILAPVYYGVKITNPRRFVLLRFLKQNSRGEILNASLPVWR